MCDHQFGFATLRQPAIRDTQNLLINVSTMGLLAPIADMLRRAPAGLAAWSVNMAKRMAGAGATGAEVDAAVSRQAKLRGHWQITGVARDSVHCLACGQAVRLVTAELEAGRVVGEGHHKCLVVRHSRDLVDRNTDVSIHYQAWAAETLTHHTATFVLSQGMPASPAPAA